MAAAAEATRVMSLRDGRAKMSKSDISDKSRINLSDNAEQIALKIQKAKTDSIEKVYFDLERRPEVSNLLGIYATLAASPLEAVCAEFAAATISDFKRALTQQVAAKVVPIGQQMDRLLQQPARLEEMLRDGAKRADAIARQNLQEIRHLVGLL